MLLSESLRNQHKTIHGEAIANILVMLKGKNCNIAELNNPIMHQYIDDQINEVISKVQVDTESVSIDSGICEANMPLKDCTTEELLSILEAIENDDISIFEELESE